MRAALGARGEGESHAEDADWADGRFRLLKYMCRIWDESFKENPEQQELIPILPLVFYQGQTSWTYSTEFADLFPESERGHSFLPRFAHALVDQSGLSPEQIQGGLKARIAQLLMRCPEPAVS